MDITTEPTADELAAANAVLARAAATQAAKVAAAAPALKAIVADDRFAPLLTAANEARDQLTPGSPLHSHLTAMVVGMTNLKDDVAQLA